MGKVLRFPTQPNRVGIKKPRWESENQAVNRIARNQRQDDVTNRLRQQRSAQELQVAITNLRKATQRFHRTLRFGTWAIVAYIIMRIL